MDQLEDQLEFDHRLDPQPMLPFHSKYYSLIQDVRVYRTISFRTEQHESRDILWWLLSKSKCVHN